MRLILITLLAFAITALADEKQSTKHPIEVELKKSEDSARLSFKEDITIIALSSKSGIGAATLRRTGETWPQQIAIRLELRYLEFFQMDNASIRFITSQKYPQRVPFWKLNTSQNENQPQGTLEAKLSKKEDWFELIVPIEITEGNPERLPFSWIDAYRT